MSTPGYLAGAPTRLGAAPTAAPQFNLRTSVTAVPRRDRPQVFARLNAQREAFRRLDVDDAARQAQLTQLREEMERNPEAMDAVRRRLAAPGPAAPQAATRPELTLGEGIAGVIGGLSGGRWADAARAAAGMAESRQGREFENARLDYQNQLADRQRADQAAMLEYQELVGDRQFGRQQIADLEREGRATSAQRAAMEFNARLGDIEGSERWAMFDENRDWDRERMGLEQEFQRGMADTAWGRQIAMRAEDRADSWSQLVARLYGDAPSTEADARTRIGAIRRITDMANAAGANLPAMDESAAQAMIEAGRAAERFELQKQDAISGRWFDRQNYEQSGDLAAAEAILRTYPRESPEYARAYAQRDAILRGGGGAPAGGVRPAPMQGDVAGGLRPMAPGAPGVGLPGGFAPPAVPTERADHIRGLTRRANEAGAALSASIRAPQPRDSKGRRAWNDAITKAMREFDTLRELFVAEGLEPPPYPPAVQEWLNAISGAVGTRGRGGASAARPAAAPKPGRVEDLPPVLRPQGGNRIIGIEED